MSSTATTYINSINTNYPVPGVDNDTQGFRDNYANIKTALATLASEVGNVQLNGVVTNDTNNFSYQGTLSKPILNSYAESAGLNTTPTASNITVSAIEGNYQSFNVNGSLNIDVTDWPSDPAAIKSRVMLEIYNSSVSSANISFSNTLGNLKKDLSLPITISSSSTVFVELWTANAGSDVFLRKIGGSFV